MDDSIAYPTWKDVGIPEVVVSFIKNMSMSNMLSYLVTNRVFRFMVKSRYTYRCRSCDYSKNIRIFESYDRCEACGSRQIFAVSSYVMGKDQCRALDENIIPIIIQKMNENYSCYFKRYPPQNFFYLAWCLQHVEIAQQEVALGADAPHDEEEEEFRLPEQRPSVSVQFASGERVESSSQTLAVCKAAVLCPFLWDDLYDWKYHVHKDRNRETPILPLLNMWAKLRGRSSYRSFMPSIQDAFGNENEGE